MVVILLDEQKKYKKIPDEAFKRGAELIIYEQIKLTKKQREKKSKDIEEQKAHCLFGDLSEEELNNYIEFYDYKVKLKCPYCETNAVERGFTTHLKQHNITKEEFTDMYGGVSLIEMTANKMFKWYSPNVKKWALQGNIDDIDYYTITTEKQKIKLDEQNKNNDDKRKPYIPLYLNSSIIKGHLNRNHTIAIYPWGKYAGWISFDVDTGEEEAFSDAQKIVDTMVNYGIERKNILITFSGKKGYHIEIFLKYPMKYDGIKKFGKKILFLAGKNINKKFWNDKIEIRPTDSAGIKLSLGVNQKTNKKTRILNEQMNFFEHEYQDHLYFLNIDKVDNDLIYSIRRSTDQPEEEIEKVQEAENINAEKNITEPVPQVNIDIEEFEEDDFSDEEYTEFKFSHSLDYKIKAVENKFKNGLTKEGTRNKWAYAITVWMRDTLKIDRNTAEEELIKWTERNLEFIKNENSAFRNASEVVNCVYDNKNKYKFTSGLKKRILNFYPDEIKLIKKIQRMAKKEKQAKTKAPSSLFFTFICLAKIFNSNPFFISKNHLLDYSKLSNNTLYNWLDWLKGKGFIELKKRGSSYTKLASEYYVPSIALSRDNVDSISIELINNELDIKKLYNKIIK